jgi:hypothetical protein
MNARRLSARRFDARRFREEAASLAAGRTHPAAHVGNGEESDYTNPAGQLSYVANYSKALPHNQFGEVVPAAYRSLLRALYSQNPDHFEQITLGMPNTGRNLTNPQAGLALDLEGPDAYAVTLPPAPRIDGPENSAEMAELYWMALLRDVHFSDYATNAMVSDAVTDLNGLTDFRGPKDQNGQVTAETLFRGLTEGDTTGPYVSQFLLLGSADAVLGPTPSDGYIKYGTLRIDQRQKTAQAGQDYLTDFADWRAVQRGRDDSGTDAFDATRRFIRNLRDLATYVHFDALYEAYLNACLILLSMNARLDPGNPYTDSRTQDGFGTFGGPHILSLVCEVATRALKAVWHQKWGVHRRLRPEAFGGRIQVHRNGINAAGLGQDRYDGIIDSEILNSAAVAEIESQHGTALLPQAFPEGSPTHPAYGAGHATVAGACVTVLKAWFDESVRIPNPVVPNANGTALNPIGNPALRLTVGGELNKVAANIAIGRNAAGVHWRTDYTESIRLGEQIAIGILEEQKPCYSEDHHLSVTRFDGTTVVI